MTKRILRARGRVPHIRGQMTKLEQRYAAELAVLKKAGEIDDFRFEEVRLRVGLGAFYTPDFLVITDTGMVEFHECKGHWEEAARVRFRAVIDRYPWFRFLLVTQPKARLALKIEKIGPGSRQV